MKKRPIWFFLFGILILLNVFATSAYINKLHRVERASAILDEIDQFATAPAPVQANGETQVQVVDGRASNLKNFFRKYNSPLYEHADFIVKTADKYGFDYRLLPAIAMQESGLCRAIPNNSHNCWGWGIYGNTVTRFASYPEAIEAVSKGIKKGYIDQGLVTATQIMSKYAPTSNSWARAVNSIMQYLE